MSTQDQNLSIANQWRRFNFFDVMPITDPGEAPIYFDNQVVSVGSGKETLYLGTRTGCIRAVSKDLELLNSWTAHDQGSVDFLFAPQSHNVLVSVSHIPGSHTEVSLWSTKSNATAKLISSAKITNGDNTQPLTSFSCAKDATVLAFGYADGAVIVLRGDLVHDRGSRQRSVANCSAPITGLHLYGDMLFVTTLQQVLVASTTGSRTQKVLEKQGVELNCSAMFGDQLVVAREQGVAFYHIDHRGASREFTVPKKALYVYKHFLVLVTIHKMLGTDTYRVVILDTLNDLLPFDGQVSPNIRQVFVQWNQLGIIGSTASGDGILYLLREKPLMQQLEILKQQMLFPIAIRLAENSQASEKVVMSLHQDYGDYLDEKGDSELALKHYLAAIDLGDTSHVIMRYKDSHKVSILAEYLEELEAKGLASSHHLTLLMICYTNLRDTERLGAFVQRVSSYSTFDFDSAIELCRKSGYSEIATHLAEKSADSDLVVQIKLFDLKDYYGCLEFIRTISVNDALWTLVQHSRALLNELPVETTSVLIQLFTGKFVPRASKTADNSSATPTPGSTPLLQSYQAFVNYITLNKFNDREVFEKDEYEITYQPPRPALIFPSFIGHNNEFVIFLEACLENAQQFQPSKKDLSDIVTTLYQVYLSLSKQDNPEEWDSKAHALINGHNDLLDANTVLMVTKLNNISLSPSQLTQLGGSFLDIFRDLVDAGSTEAALEVLDKVLDTKHNEANELCRLALLKMSNSSSFFEALKPKLTRFLETCTALGVASPVQIIDIACKSSFITVGDMKPYMLAQIKQEQSEIKSNEKVSGSYERDIAEKQHEISALINKPQTVQNNVCTVCSMALELPVVHFACKHSYHKRCLGDSTKCPVCVPELESIDTIRSSELQASARSELFSNSLESSKDPLKVITDYISRGALAKQ